MLNLRERNSPELKKANDEIANMSITMKYNKMNKARAYSQMGIAKNIAEKSSTKDKSQ